MKKTSLVLSAGFLIGCANAHAQSSVLLFGVLDEGINYTNNVGGKSSWQMASGDLSTSRWGIKGNEDLGGGLHAIFDLESGFAIESGQLGYGGRLFGFQSYVGLQSDRLGTLTLGRQFDSVSDTIGPLTANGSWAGFLFSHPLDNDNTDASFHANNAVKYTSPTIAGVSGTVMIGLSNAAAGFTQNRMLGVGLNYTYRTLSVAAVYENLSNPGTTTGGALTPDDTGFVAGNQKIYGIGMNYGIGPATLGAVYSHVNVGRPDASLYAGDLGLANARLTFDNLEVNAKYDITPALMVGGMYTYTRGGLDRAGAKSSLHWNQLGAIAQYSLSKRTSVYTQIAYQQVDGSATGTPLDGALVPGSPGASSNGHQIVGRVALNHAF
ncbi:outer membrane porin OpcP [Burkholderia pseudomultivorans]|uniref:Outer membrane porin OpcP n=1 Tax=Burkholderia pseudomultivorans TaxID=1207504 RepID=A0A6P2HSK6_9BURK|nr:porin [Burkholderia pseudomultivorans]VWB20210.1 outer membrane porin OpcP [Burkholderia pseudomultivorans]